MSQTLKKILEAYPINQFTTAIGFDEAVVGVDLDSSRLIYSVNRCIDILVYSDGMDAEEAIEHFENTIRDSYDDDEFGPIWASTEF
jgi:hypothetical protein